MKQKHWIEHCKELEQRRFHKERRAANRARRRAAAGLPPKKPGPYRRNGLYARSGGAEAAAAWFSGLPAGEQARIVAPSPDGLCKRGRAKAIRAFQQHLVDERDRKQSLDS